MADTRRPCPCCGNLVFDVDDGWPGSFAICAVCGWADDNVQFRWPFMSGGANKVSLYEAQRNFVAYGACDRRARKHARPAAEDEPVDPARLCWWRPEFWANSPAR